MIKNMTVPDVGGATEVTVIEILVKPGDNITADTPIVTLESDKATMEIPTTDAGVVKEIKVKIGDKVTTDSVILTLEAEASEKKASAEKKETAPEPPAAKKDAEKAESAPSGAKKEAENPESAQPPAAKKEIEKPESAPPAQPILTGTLESASVHAGPLVRRMARELGVNLGLVKGTGPKQRIIKEDVQGYVKNQLMALQKGEGGYALPSLPVVDFSKFGPIQARPLSRIKKISGKNLARNWMMIPHVTQFGAADITALEEFRQARKGELEKQAVKLTPLVFIMKAVVASLKAFPTFNASLDVNGETLIMKDYFHLGIAVDTPDGLVVPVIRDVDKKGLVDLAKELAVVSEKARKKQLTPQDMQGSCFSISSLGGIGGSAFTPIINYPEVAILGVSKSAYQPIFQSGNWMPRLMLPLSLSYDHRVVDGAEGARFMVHLTDTLGDIRNLLM